MLEMNWIGWLVVGLIAGAISGSMLGGTTARGCLPNVVVGILGGVLGGWLATQMGFGQAQGFVVEEHQIQIRSEATAGFYFAFGSDDERLAGAFTVVFLEPLTIPTAISSLRSNSDQVPTLVLHIPNSDPQHNILVTQLR